MSNTKKRASQEQLEMMLSCLCDNTSMATGRYNGQNGRQKNADDWNSLAKRLNAVGIGAVKTGDKWQQAWRDWRSNVKKKATKLRQEEGRTGGDKINLPPLTMLEETVLSILGDVAVSGIEGAQETQPTIIDECSDILISIENLTLSEPILDIDSGEISLECPRNVEQIVSIADGVDENLQTPIRPKKRKLASDGNNKFIKKKMQKPLEDKFLELEIKKTEHAQKVDNERLEQRARELDLQERQIQVQERQTLVQESSLECIKQGLDLFKRFMER